jgi:hypothetical protein
VSHQPNNGHQNEVKRRKELKMIRGKGELGLISKVDSIIASPNQPKLSIARLR